MLPVFYNEHNIIMHIFLTYITCFVISIVLDILSKNITCLFGLSRVYVTNANSYLIQNKTSLVYP